MDIEEQERLDKHEHRSLLGRVLIRMTLYYLVLAGLVALINWLAPSFIQQLPLGGLNDIAQVYDPGTSELEDALLAADEDDLEVLATQVQETQRRLGPVWFQTAKALFLAMLSTLILMIPVGWVHKSIHERSLYDHSLDETTLVLPAVVAGIVTVVQHSLALAFSLAGIVAGVRFRRALSDTFDTLFIFVAIGVGIAAGIKSIEIAAVLTMFFNYATIGVCLFGDGLESQHLAREKRLRKERKREKREAELQSESL